ncbi:MAG: ABC transporter ATP-binding protein [Proteobacteria bacterium]|nr:ABC transporter ATP-binding protein [Pseudomonadota bacterium]
MSLLMKNFDIRIGGVPHLDNVSLEFKRGKLYTILGRTLSGKTTLLRTIAGLETPQKGELTLHEKEFLSLPVWKRGVAMVYQQFINYPHLNVLGNVTFPLKRAHVPMGEAKKRAREVLGKVGLSDFEKRKPRALSGGQQQRVALARALVKRSDILLLDEPLVNLDYKLREQLREEFLNIFQGQDDAIVIYTTTEPGEAIQLGHELIVMDEGAVIQRGDPLKVFNSPSTIRCAEIINDPPMNILQGSIGGGVLNLRGKVTFPVPDHLKELSDGAYLFGLQAADLCIGGDISGKVLLSEISGSQTILHMQGGIGSFIVHEAGVYHHSIGSTIEIGIDKNRIYVFSVDGKLMCPPTITSGEGR